MMEGCSSSGGVDFVGGFVKWELQEEGGGGFEVGRQELCLICASPGHLLWQQAVRGGWNVHEFGGGSLSPHLCSMFVLRKLLKLSLEECEKILRRCGGDSPGGWFSLCDACGEVVCRGLEVHGEIGRLLGSLAKIQDDVKRRLERSLEGDWMGDVGDEGSGIRSEQPYHIIRNCLKGKTSADRVGEVGETRRITRRMNDYGETTSGGSTMTKDAPNVVLPAVKQDAEDWQDELSNDISLPDEPDDNYSDGGANLVVSDGNDSDEEYSLEGSRKKKRRKGVKTTGTLKQSRKDCSSSSKDIDESSRSKLTGSPKKPTEKKKVNYSRTCTRCNITFTCWSVFRNHMQSHTVTDNFEEVGDDSNLFRCKLCGHESSKIKMYIHLAREHDLRCRQKTRIGELKCPFCGNLYNFKHNLEEHIRKVHAGQKMHKCETCGEEFGSEFMFQNHIAKHLKVEGNVTSVNSALPSAPTSTQPPSKEGSYRCEICNVVYKCIAPYKAHKADHNNPELIERGLQCKLCKYVGRTENMLRTHGYAYHAKASNTCTRCNISFSDRTVLKNHMQSHTVTDHFEYLDGERWIRCKLCGKEDSKGLMYRHMAEVHSLLVRGKPKTKDSHMCHMCEKVFPSSVILRNHIKTAHEGQRRYKCDKCGRGFNTKMLFEDHIAKHENNDTNPFVCEHCAVTFSTRANLNHHYFRSHLRDPEKLEKKRRTCEHCGLSVLNINFLNQHMREAHRELFPHKCDLCPAVYKERKYLRAHVEGKHSDTKLQCEFCRSTNFSSRINLNFHMKHNCKLNPNRIKVVKGREGVNLD